MATNDKRITLPSTAIPNNVYDAMMQHNFTASDLKILLTVARKTYGWNKNVDAISASQFEIAGCGSARNVKRRITELVTCKSLVAYKSLGTTSKYAINLKTEEWKDPPTGDTQTTSGTSDIQVQKPVTPRPPTKETTKERYTPTSKNSLTACTPQELAAIAKDLKITLQDVTQKHSQMLDKIEDGSFQQKKYGKTVYFTLRSWLRGDIASGKITTAGKLEQELEAKYGLS